MAKHMNYLDFEKRERLANWMRTNRDDLCKLTKHEAAAEAEKALGFPVTFANCDGLKKKLGIEFIVKRARKGNGHARVGKRTVELHQLRVVQIQHARYLKRIYEELGMDHGKDLDILAESNVGL